MDASLRNTPALISESRFLNHFVTSLTYEDHIDKLTAQLVNRFVNIVDLAKVRVS
jgi:hypothetical protein